ncbi:pyroglutamyl-peptidase I [Agrococcus baldri]|uniref:Pyrrolidone-carboxylate peptidase n=1 Tax=Agrococcus baldri TaxID=153730 RepID=A0AA94HM02_9MICO|nr:SRPBCC domain-containing protein [Agrococcus baldri]SFS09003.1 pyroglutamyl-peptidase I [Agrococcus baldri]
MKMLVTGFEPFGGDPENASHEAVRRLADAWAADPQAGVELVTGVLPVAFAAAGPALTALVDEHAPDAVLAVGEAGSRSAITPERWAVNADDARIPDNGGDQPRGTVIDPEGPARRESAFDADALASAVLAVGLPADASEDAGRFLCNHVAYLVAGLRRDGAPIPGGFVHVPAVRSSGTATVGAETDAPAARSALATETGTDASRDASALTHDGEALTFDDLALGLAAMVRAVASGDAQRASTRETGRVDRASTVIDAAPEVVYEALLDPVALAAWLPPEGATGTIEHMDAREGGGFRAVLRFADPADTKTDATTDVSQVRFVELVPGSRVEQTVTFDSGEERFRGEMRMTWRLEPVEAGTRVTVAATDVPAGISQSDHELGLGSSLANLARHLAR